MATINQGYYCQIDPNNPIAVDDGPRRLPQNWVSPYETQPNGRPVEYNNINNTDIWNNAELLSIGWYPYILSDTPPTEYPQYYDKSYSDFQIQATEVLQTAVYTQWDIERVREQKNAELESKITQYSANEISINPKVNDYISNELKWFSDAQAELARLDVWEDVAGYNTSKPNILILPNNFVGASYVKQGELLTAENTSATNAGLTPPWDQTIVNDFITANKLAAEDNSGGTVPVEPTFEIRQGIAVPSEQAARIVIFRVARDDPNPALRTTYKMRLLNRKDDRDLYVFSYTGLTYLTWRLFENLGGGTWGLEATSAEWQYVPNDMAFIFSYGTNPAVESDYFTDRVEFPAGVAEENIYVAWNSV